MYLALAEPSELESPAPPRDAAVVHAEHAGLVWANLQRMGVRYADLDDMVQEVFIVVHQRLGSYDPTASLKAWLFGICLRVASAYRRRAYRRMESPAGAAHEVDASGRAEGGPEEALEAGEARARLRAILDEMDVEKRAVFVMFEIDELGCDEIAGTMGVPVGTVYSRLHAARKEFEKVLARHRARAGGGAGR